MVGLKAEFPKNGFQEEVKSKAPFCGLSQVMFEEADLDQSGTMEAAELAELLKNLGIEPMSHVLLGVEDMGMGQN